MRMTLLVLVMVLALGWPSERALGQVTKAAIGTGVGVAGGAMITMSLVVARARFQGVYLDSAEDLIDWHSVPMLLTPAVGLAFGLAGKEALVGSIVGSTTGLLGGAVVGAGIGWLVSPLPEGPWAGGVIGAGAGMTVAGLALGIRGYLRSRDEPSAADDMSPTRIEFRVPL